MNILLGNHFSPLSPELENSVAGGACESTRRSLRDSGRTVGLRPGLVLLGRGPWSQAPRGGAAPGGVTTGGRFQPAGRHLPMVAQAGSGGGAPCAWGVAGQGTLGAKPQDDWVDRWPL